MNLRDSVGEIIEGLLATHGHEGDDFLWDLAYAALPTPQGIMLINYFVLSMKSGLLTVGQEYVTTALQIPNMTMLKDPTQAEKVVVQTVATLREMRARVLAPTNGGTPAGGGLIIP